jgi:DNA-binding winged helix-turn-helix (wHTH) protein
MRISFGPFVLDADCRQLMQARREIHLTPKAFELLVALAEARPKVLSKVVLQQRLWPETFVAEANLSNLVAEIREALGDNARTPQFIRTAYGFGYAFCGTATDREGDSRPAADGALCWLDWGGHRFPLAFGENVIGRDPDLEVRLEGTTVSRRHARLVVTNEGTMLEDLGSKNGTFRGEDRVTEPVQLTNGDIIHIGSLRSTFHVRGPAGSTETLGTAKGRLRATGLPPRRRQRG